MFKNYFWRWEIRCSLFCAFSGWCLCLTWTESIWITSSWNYHSCIRITSLNTFIMHYVLREIFSIIVKLLIVWNKNSLDLYCETNLMCELSLIKWISSKLIVVKKIKKKLKYYLTQRSSHMDLWICISD